MIVAVTGGAGYIGSHVVRTLASEGLTPIVIDNLVRGHRWAVTGFPLHEVDLADTVALRSVFRHTKPDAVVHLAAFAYVGESMQYPGLYFANNVSNTVTLLECMRQEGIRSIVFSSSCATYGLPQYLPMDEQHPQQPVSVYGQSKLMAESVLRYFGDIHGIRWMSLRYFNAAGAHPDGDLGENHDPEPHLIPRAIQAALGIADPVDILGSDYPTQDGTAVRDYIHVCDLASAHLMALKYLSEGSPSLAVNLGTGHGHSVREVIAAVERVSGRPVPCRERPRRDGDASVVYATAELAHKVLGWTPRLSSLDEIVRSAWRWHARELSPQRVMRS